MFPLTASTTPKRTVTVQVPVSILLDKPRRIVYLDSHFQSVECGAFQTVGGPFENMAKYSEDFTVATWDKNGGSCSTTANALTAPDGNTTADTITAVTATPRRQSPSCSDDSLPAGIR